MGNARPPLNASYSTVSLHAWAMLVFSSVLRRFLSELIDPLSSRILLLRTIVVPEHLRILTLFSAFWETVESWEEGCEQKALLHHLPWHRAKAWTVWWTTDSSGSDTLMDSSWVDRMDKTADRHGCCRHHSDMDLSRRNRLTKTDSSRTGMGAEQQVGINRNRWNRQTVGDRQLYMEL